MRWVGLGGAGGAGRGGGWRRVRGGLEGRGEEGGLFFSTFHLSHLVKVGALISSL